MHNLLDMPLDHGWKLVVDVVNGTWWWEGVMRWTGNVVVSKLTSGTVIRRYYTLIFVK